MDNIAISLKGVSKKYEVYEGSAERLRSFLPWNKGKSVGREFWAIRNANLEIKKGEVVGIIGQNGAGKSTLLQIICKTLSPTIGELKIIGKVSALLELGSGFNLEFSGRENVYLSAAIAGMDKKEIDAKYEEIVAFSGIGEHINQPAKTYSSGMLVRLAFSVATSINPDILVIDEALSVGDGAFARKSFDRIMSLKESGCTILFCSHSLFQVEALCERAVWVEKGNIKLIGKPSDVIPKYEISLEDGYIGNEIRIEQSVGKTFRINSVIADNTTLRSALDDLNIHIQYSYDKNRALPSLVYEIFTLSGHTVTSGTSKNDGFTLNEGNNGIGQVSICFPKINLMRGRYRIDIYLMCEDGIHLYDHAASCIMLDVTQEKHEKGVVFLEHRWM